MVDVDEIDTANRQSAEARAQERAELAGEAGLKAKPRTRSQVSKVANTILTEAEAVSAIAIVMGSRGLSGVKSVLLGGVSHTVIQHTDRAVVVVPSPRGVRRTEPLAARPAGPSQQLSCGFDAIRTTSTLESITDSLFGRRLVRRQPSRATALVQLAQLLGRTSEQQPS